MMYTWPKNYILLSNAYNMQLVINLEQSANKMRYYINTSSVVAGDVPLSA